MHSAIDSASAYSQSTAQYRPAPGHASLSALILDALVFLAPFLKFVQIPIVGTLYLTEVLLAILLFLLLPSRGRRLNSRLPRFFILLLTAWLLAQIFTDMVRGSAFQDYSRGWAMIGFALINFCGLYLATAGKPRRLVLFAAGLAGGQIVGYFLAPGEYALDYPWKFGYGSGVNLLLVLLAVYFSSRHGTRFGAPAILLAVAALNIFMDFRSAGGAAFLAGSFLALKGRRSRSMSRRRSWRLLMTFGVIGVLGAAGVVQLYGYSARAGWLGDQARQKYDMQVGGDYGLLIGGRSEILVSSLAVMDSPIIGHGSWAKNCRYASLYVELRRRAGYFPGEDKHQCLIPAHSHVMGAWVQAGVVGAIVWSWALLLAIRALIGLDTYSSRVAPLIAFCAFALIWDVLFSPFSGFMRFVTPFYIVVMMSSVSGALNRAAPAGPARRYMRRRDLGVVV